jgi:L-glyceraldehyde 3-phosphate reductase
VSLGLWQNFGDEVAFEEARALALRAFDLGITHFDLANNYGRPPGSAERTLGRLLRREFRDLREEVVISTKAGYDMWQGPYGEWGSRKHLVSSIDQSLKRLGLEYVDIFYSHRPDPQVPLAETLGALADMVRQGKTLYVGISSYGVDETREAHRVLRSLGVPLVAHQPSYSLFNRWIERDGLLDLLTELGVGCVSFTALEQGLLTDKYVSGVSTEGRMSRPGSLLKPELLTDDVRGRLKGLAGIAARRGQTLAQMALAWVVKDVQVATTVVGARTIEQLEENVRALENTLFSADELGEIDEYADDLGITLWPPNP